MIALVLGVAGVVVGLIPATFWLAWAFGGIAIVLGGKAHADRLKAGQPPGIALIGWIVGIVAFLLGWVNLFFFD